MDGMSAEGSGRSFDVVFGFIDAIIRSHPVEVLPDASSEMSPSCLGSGEGSI